MESFITFPFKKRKSMGRSSITGQSADPSKRRCFIPVCGSPRPSTAEEKLPFPTEAISMGFIFQIEHCPYSNPSYTSVNPQRLYPFQEHKQTLHGVTAFGPRHACRSSSHTRGVIASIHWSRRHVAPLGKQIIGGKTQQVFDLL